MNKGHKTQVKKYGGDMGYRSEMRRRRSLRESSSRVHKGELEELVGQGMTQSQMSDATGLSQPQISRLLRKYELE